MTGASASNLEMLKAVCGAHYFQHVVLVTSMWDVISRSKPVTDFGAREAEGVVSPAFWGDLVDRRAEEARAEKLKEQEEEEGGERERESLVLRWLKRGQD